ncbi:MAG: hypothetical protein IPO92_06665 [Saprospiraceae bacterium]|nr:hypothetical protein [Saprospiraceae bacterium]
MDTRNANFVQALEHFWNGWANMRSDVLLIVCGSAASWMIKKLINNKGGLHNRVTKRLQIEPFTLAETEAFLKNLGQSTVNTKSYNSIWFLEESLSTWNKSISHRAKFKISIIYVSSPMRFQT